MVTFWYCLDLFVSESALDLLLSPGRSDRFLGKLQFHIGHLGSETEKDAA
jgi:hypothetical protein